MSTKAVIGWLIVAVVLGIGAIFAMRGPNPAGGASGPGVGSLVLNFSPSAVRSIAINPLNERADTLTRADNAAGDWLLRLGDATRLTDWPVPGRTVDGLLLALSEARSVAAGPKAPDLGEKPTVATLALADGTSLTLRFAQRSLGGTGLLEIQTSAGKTVAIVDDRLHQMVRDRNIRQWRDRTAMPWARGDASRIRLENKDRAIAFGRIGSRWSLREPVQAPADGPAVGRLLSTLAEAQIVEFVDDAPGPGVQTGLDAPNARILVEIDRPEGTPIRHTLDIGAAADARGERMFALIDGQRTVKIDARNLGQTMDAAAYLWPHPTAVAAPDVGMIVIERLDASRVPEDGRVFKRSLDRWIEIREGSEVPVVEQELKEMDEALAFLTGTGGPAGAPRPQGRLAEPEAYRPGARVSLRDIGGQPLETVEVGVSGVSALAIVRTGAVYREYPLDRLPRLIDRVMRSSPLVTPPPRGEQPEAEENK
ncbi:MAG: DUF4340 domain-containing protein [Phycisphaeraceae bacterium]|nr:DUF4340 domain-containing protein [Phycisphaeraceae bacterium]